MNPIAIITTLFSFFNKTDTGAKVGAGVSNIATLAVLAPVVIALYHWFDGHKNDVAVEVQITWGTVALTGAILFSIVEVLRATRPRSGS